MKSDQIISGRIVDVFNRRIFGGQIHLAKGRIKEVMEASVSQDACFIIPGFIDAHVHIESSMLPPAEFGRMALPHGTVATVSDPHEIANVLGLSGVEYMLENAVLSPLKIYFGAPSCVPATHFETAGAGISLSDIEYLFKHEDIKYLSEMMNFPGVLNKDEDVMAKIQLAHDHGRTIDGHAPGLRGEDARDYAMAGISTDHECVTLEEALDKLQLGMKILIREGSAARNFDALIPLLPEYYGQIMFCSDDKHPNDLAVGHINDLVARSVGRGYDVMNVLRCACINPVEHYDLDVGMLRPGDPADFLEVENLTDFKVLTTYIDGEKVAENGRSLSEFQTPIIVNNFHRSRKNEKDFQVPHPGGKALVIEALDGQLITTRRETQLKMENGLAVSDVEQDVLKISVVNRYDDVKPAVGFIANFGLKSGAIASSVAHDSHNIVCVGVDDHSMAKAVNAVMEIKGGLSVIHDDNVDTLPLPIAGLISDKPGEDVARNYIQLDDLAKKLGSQLSAPFMTLSFMALLVIPDLKLGDKGLFDVSSFELVGLFDTSI